MSLVDDGYIVGAFSAHQKKCPRCGLVTKCIDISRVDMPRSFGVEATILFDRQAQEVLPWIGVGCGDYAKFHRQLVWIQTRMGAGRGD